MRTGTGSAPASRAAAPPERSGDAAAVVHQIRHIHDRLAAMTSLRPGPEVDELLHRLVGLVVTTPPDRTVAVLADPAVVALRPSLVALCARAEHELELAWAERVVASRVPRLALLRFPDLHNYALLTALEHAALARATVGPLRRILFVGAGPLALSVLHLARRFDVPVDGLDRDPAAVALARRLRTSLDAAGEMAFHHGDVGGRPDLRAYDLVILAALVGVTADDKRRHLRHLHRAMAPGAVLLGRSAHGLRTLLYPEIDPRRLHGFRLLSITHPTGWVLNSTLLARKPTSGGEGE